MKLLVLLGGVLVVWLIAAGAVGTFLYLADPAIKKHIDKILMKR